MKRTITKLLDGGKFFEGARWHDDHWWVSDLYTSRVLKISELGECEVVAEVEQQPSGLGWLPDGSLLVVAMMDKRIFRISPQGEKDEHVNLAASVDGFINDMVVDHMGRAYVGSTGFDMFSGEAPKKADLVRVDPDGSISVVASEMGFPNGMIITPDRSTLVVAETFGAVLTAFDIKSDGSLNNRRTLIEFGPAPSWATFEDMVKVEFAPDGCAVDKNGCIWVADAIGNRVSHISQKGEILEEISAPDGFGLYSCALGGADKRTLLLCCAPCFDRDACMQNVDAVLFTCQVEVPFC